MKRINLPRTYGSWLFLGFACCLFLVVALDTGLRPLAASPASNPAAITLDLEEFASGFNQPVKITHAGDDRLFIVEQEGFIRIVQADGTKLDTPFLDIRSRVESGASEQGLLGLAFDPDDPSIFYVNYTRKSSNAQQRGDTVIARYRVSTADPNRADPNSEQIVLVIDQPFGNHNAGDLAFGPDGYLYIPMGDGGSGGDPNNYAQNLAELLGKVLRIDVSGVTTYTIPSDNPYANDNNPNTRAEIWSSGWRNPWRFSFDRATGDLYFGDVGQGAWEEIDFEAANTPGRNYGWKRCEGSYIYPAQNPPQKCSTTDALVEPIFDYPRAKGSSVTGGYVYRGVQYPNMVGHYIFADFGSGNFWSATPNGQDGWNVVEHGELDAGSPSTFGEDSDGELYVANYGDGAIYRVRDASPVTTPTNTPSPTNTLTPVTPTLVPTAFPSLTPASYLPLIDK